MFNFPETCQVATFEPRLCLSDLPAAKKRQIWNWLKDNKPEMQVLFEDVKAFEALGLPVEKIFISPSLLPPDLAQELEEYTCTEP